MVKTCYVSKFTQKGQFMVFILHTTESSINVNAFNYLPTPVLLFDPLGCEGADW